MFQAISKKTPVRARNWAKINRKRNNLHLHVDVPFLLIVATLIIFGLLMVYSASWDYSIAWYGSPTTIFVRQLQWLGIGIIIAVILTFLNYKILKKLALPAMIGTLLLLVAVLLVGDIRNGAIRTLFSGSVQPSELAKLVVIIYLAVWLNAKQEQLIKFGFGILPLGIILGITSGLIFLQPDLSAVITLIILGGLMFFLGGGDLRQIAVILILVLIIGGLVVQFNTTGSERVAQYLSGLKNPTEGSYHVRRAMESFVKGGWFGVGIGKADTKFTGLPVPPTDSIFAVVGEETGAIGALFLVSLYGTLLWRGLVLAQRAKDNLGRLLLSGLAVWLGIEAFINMAVMVNVLPFAGNALPFISAGGSSLVVSLAAIGIMMNVARTTIKEKDKVRRKKSAVVDLRRWNRRRSLSGSGSPAGTDSN